MNRTLALGITCCALLTLGRGALAQSPPNQLTVPFSDPSRPGTVKVSVMSGSISVKPGTGRDVVVTTTRDERDRDSDDRREQEQERERQRERERQNRGRRSSDDDPSSAGLRRLTQPAGVTAEEENNVISISSPVLSGPVNLTILVPAATNLVLHAINGGQVSVDGILGSLDVNNVNGSIRLTDVGGPVTAHATNGQVVATLRQVAAGKPMSFTSFNGNVDVTLPGSAKANLKLRSDRGDVYTDFDVQTTAGTARPQSPDARDNDARSRGRDGRDRDADAKDKPKYRMELDRSIYGLVNGGGPDFELRTFNGNIYLRKAK